MEADDLESEGVEIIVGTYEEFVLGYKILGEGKHEDGTPKYKLTQSFTNHSHCGSIRAVAIGGKYLASGSTDEAIRLINMGMRVEHGYMQQQTGTITCITNYGSKYMFSGSTDGTICIWKCGSWICEKTLQAHKGGVLDVSIHPSGKLALSVGMDRSLKTWNLIKGRTGFVTNLHGVADSVRWSPEGTYYAVGVSNRLDVYSVVTAKVVYSVPFGKRVSCICFPKEDIVLLAGDKDMVEVHSIKESKKLSEFKAHKVRVKDMRFVEHHNLLVTGSNCDQFIKLWRFEDKSFSSVPKLLTELDTTCRITCLTVWSKRIAQNQSDVATLEPETAVAKDGDIEISDDDKEEEEEEEEDEGDKPPKSKKSKQLKPKAVKKNKNSNLTESKSISTPKNPQNSSKSSKQSKINSDPPKRKKKLSNKS